MSRTALPNKELGGTTSQVLNSEQYTTQKGNEKSSRITPCRGSSTGGKRESFLK